MTVHRKSQHRGRWPPGRCACQHGFTLIELIMVIVVLGIVSIYAAPRMFNTADFYARGFHDETLALLRFAQKTAIAQRRTVCVAVVTTGASLSIAAAEGSASCGSSLNGPTGGAASVTARSGVYFSLPGSTPLGFNFNGLGQPSAAQSLQVSTASGTAGNPIIVEAETGYVHD